jgi:Mg2+ and Co2+ transporter CorA
MIIARRVIQHWQKQRINKQKKHANYSAANVVNNSMVVDEQCSIDHAEYHAAVITKSILLTYATATTPIGAHHATNATVDYMIRGNDNEVILLHDGSSSAALLSWLEFHLLNTQNALTKLRQVSKFMSKRMDIYPESISISDILNLQDDILSVLSVTEEQTHCLDMLRDIDNQCDGVNFTNVDGVLSMLVKTAKSNEMLGTRLERRVLGIKTAFTTHQQDKMNKRLAVLTTLSAIFMPLTFIAGVYGMNFEYLPELHYHYAYFVVLIIMFVLGV